MRFSRIRPRAIAAAILPALMSSALFQTPSSNAAETPNFGYLGYTWVTPSIAEFEVSPPIVTETIKEYQIGASYSLSSCDGLAQICSYSNMETLKSLSPSSLSTFRDVTINRNTASPKVYRDVKKFQITATEMQQFLSARTNAKDRSLVFSVRAIYGNTVTEWSDRNVATPTEIWRNSSNEKNLTIGYQGPLSGPEAVIGLDQIAAVRYAIANFNREYVGRYQVSLVEIDDQGDPSVATKVAPTVAANSKILAIVGPAYSGATLASLPSYKNVGLPMISPSAIRETLTDPTAPTASQGSPIFHRIAGLDRNQAQTLYKLATDGVSTPKLFIIDDTSLYSTGLSSNLQKVIPAGQFVGGDSVNPQTTDWTPTVMKARTSGANVVIYTGYSPQTIEFVKQLRNSGYAGVFATGDGSYTDALTTSGYSSAIENLRLTTGSMPIELISRALSVDMRSTTGRTPGLYAAEAIDAANVILYCIATGVDTRKDMLSCIKSFSGESVYGDTFGFDNFGDNTTQRFASLVVRNKAFESFASRTLDRSSNSRWWPWILSSTGGNSSSNTNTNQNTSTKPAAEWSARPISSVPRPAGLFPGLSQTTFNTYFDDNLELFKQAPNESSIVTNLPIWNDGNRANKSYEWTGYFIPDTSGNWSFKLTSDDAAYFWLGDSAVSSFRSNPRSAIVSLPGQHAQQTAIGTINLVKDQVYPLRINYGNWANTTAIFQLEFKPAGYESYQQNFQSLIWYSTPGSCTNWGIDYAFANTVTSEQNEVPRGCPSSSSVTSSKPTTPSFSGVNFVGNKINIAVNIGSNAASRPDKVYLVAPKLGITAGNPLAGSISGSNATWSIDFDKLLGGTMIPLEVVSEKDGVKSDPVTGSYQAPIIAPAITSVPPTPTNFKSRIVGSSAVVTAEVAIKAGALATNSYLVSNNLGFTSARPLEGEVAGSKIIMEIDVKPSMAGKKYPVSIYLTNSKGKSKSLQGVVSIPKAPSVPKIPSVVPKPKTAGTVICVRPNQTRTFAGTKCPPGWEQP